MPIVKCGALFQPKCDLCTLRFNPNDYNSSAMPPHFYSEKEALETVYKHGWSEYIDKNTKLKYLFCQECIMRYINRLHSNMLKKNTIMTILYAYSKGILIKIVPFPLDFQKINVYIIGSEYTAHMGIIGITSIESFFNDFETNTLSYTCHSEGVDTYSYKRLKIGWGSQVELFVEHYRGITLEQYTTMIFSINQWKAISQLIQEYFEKGKCYG